MPQQTLYMETTQVPALKTAGEIQALLVQAGARQIAMQYGPAQQIIGMAFTLDVQGQIVPFSLPVRVEPVFQYLLKKGKNRYRVADTKAQAERVAWRQLLRWIQAQLALIQTGMVETAEVFMPYISTQAGRTMFEVFREQGLKALPAPEQPA